MAKVEKFEDLICWQKARQLTKSIYAATREKSLRTDFGFCSQIQRAAVSIMSNIAEGFERSRRPEFHQFLSVAKSSCAEVRSHLYVALDAGYLSPAHFQQLLTDAEEVGRIVGGLRAAVERQRT